MRLPLFLLAAAVAFAADASRVVYTKSFPGSVPAYVHITVDRDGMVSYKESADDDPETFQIERDAVTAIYELADKLGHFKNPLESGLKVANTGQKTFRWEDGAGSSESKFNYSTDESAHLLQDWFERIGESETLMLQLKRVVRYDKLGVNDAVLRIQIAWDRKRLVGLAQLVPLLDRTAANEAFINMARERARELAQRFRDTLKSQTP